MEGVFRFKSWFLNAPGFIHRGTYYRTFTAPFDSIKLLFVASSEKVLLSRVKSSKIKLQGWQLPKSASFRK